MHFFLLAFKQACKRFVVTFLGLQNQCGSSIRNGSVCSGHRTRGIHDASAHWETSQLILPIRPPAIQKCQ
jgi:hypothetical protein